MISCLSMRTPGTFLLGVLMGTASAISCKVLYGLESRGSSGDAGYFSKPLFLTWTMFIAMSLAMPIHWIKECYYMKSVREKDSNTRGRSNWRTLFLLLVPTCFDLAATALAAAGLLYTTVSVYQLVRCSVMIVTALLKATVLRQSLTSYQWIGIIINTVAMVLISAISFVPDHMDAQPGMHGDPRLGILLVLLSCVVQGSQYVFEEKLMTEEAAAPLLVVGMEGVWGSLLMPLIVLPWAEILPGQDEGGCMENLWDSLVMIGNSTAIQGMLVVYFTSVFFFNIFAIYVTFFLSSVWHAILENFRPGAVWITDLALFYMFTNGKFGESWTKWSGLELAGMVVMFVGTAIYNGTLEVPFCHYPLPTDERVINSDWTKDCATPLTASPLIQRGVAHEHRLASKFGFSSIHNLHSHSQTIGFDHESSSPDDEECHPLSHGGMGRSYGNSPNGRLNAIEQAVQVAMDKNAAMKQQQSMRHSRRTSLDRETEPKVDHNTNGNGHANGQDGHGRNGDMKGTKGGSAEGGAVATR